MKAPKIATCTHRGQRSFRWKVRGKPRYRKIQPGDVEQQRANLLLEILAGPKLVALARTINDHITDYIDHLRATTNEAWADLTDKRLRRIITTAKITRLQDLTAPRIDTAICSIRCTPRKPKRDPELYPLLSENSRNHHRQVAKSWSKWLHQEGRTPTYSLQKLKKRKVRQQRHRRDGLTPDEVAALIATTEKSTVSIEGYDGVTRAWIYRIAACTGFRRKELAFLTPESFDVATKALRLPPEATKNGEPATRRLPAKTVPRLSRWLRGRVGPLFPLLASRRVCKMIRLDLIAAGLPIRTSEGGKSFHSLRNSYITRLWATGLPGPVVQRMARHSDIRLTVAYDRSTGDEASAVDGLYDG